MTNPKRKTGRRGRKAVADVAGQLAALNEMTIGQLKEKYREVFGEPTRSRNKPYLQKKLAWRIQELAEGGLSDETLAKIDELGTDVPVRWRRKPSADKSTTAADAHDNTSADTRDPRLPTPGTVLTRVYKGVEHQVTVIDDGFAYQGERHSSLSQLARMITGTNWNGFLFWGLERRTRRKAQATAVTP